MDDIQVALAQGRVNLGQAGNADFGLISFGDIPENEHHPQKLPGRITDQRSAVRDLVFSAVEGQKHRVVGQPDRRPARNHLPRRVLDRFARPGIDDAEHLDYRPAFRLRKRPSGQPLGDRVHAGDSPFRIGGDHRVSDGLQGEGQVCFALAQRLLRLPASCDEPRLLDVLVGLAGNLTREGEQRLGRLLKACLGHDRYFGERLAELLAVSSNLVGIAEHLLFVLRLVADLSDEPVGDVLSPDRDARPRVPQPAAQARLDDRTRGTGDAERRIGLVAVAAPDFRLADDLAAQTAEIAGLRDRSSIRLRDDRRHSRRVGKLILQLLEIIEIDQV